MKIIYYLMSMVLTFLLFPALESNASIITVNVDGTDYTYNTTTKKYTYNGHTYSNINLNQSFDFIAQSTTSQDIGSDKINIVDYILEGRLQQGGNHTYTLLNGSSSNFNGLWFGDSINSLIIDEIAGYNETNTFGYYTNDGNKVQIFSGSATNGAQSLITLPSDQYLGFYLGVPVTNNIYYTDNLKNISKEIHAAIFRVDDSNNYIIGFEDQRLNVSDKDYQDMIVSVTVATPEPGTMLLMGVGTLGAALLRRRRTRVCV